MDKGIVIPDGNDAIRQDLPAIVELIEKTSRWVHPETFKRLPVWAPHAARGRPLYDASWTRRSTNKPRDTQITLEKFEGNVAALNALKTALDIANPKPKNWTVCHIWGYDDPSFSQKSSVVQDPRYYSCIANMIWLPTSLKAFTDTVPEIRTMLRVCAFHLYSWVCEYPSFEAEASKIRSGYIPPLYPQKWPTKERFVLPEGTSPFSTRLERAIERQKHKIRSQLNDPNLRHYPRDEVRAVLNFWGITL